ncbi:FadR/GntR family transcriptional regulator [Aureimonas leprariae]|uniref:FadR family transcriptional regulator n=1 Tax=Plantimonas leprariae TaxID=2615207 RepID=A0A7V7TUZ4_9HYPH|nr:FadR/GntR family transcriptional regulator [Aureimonas leprariae]KAB0677239.1 FadR family transcriptional regulator [Aureimonas leprariae]
MKSSTFAANATPFAPGRSTVTSGNVTVDLVNRLGFDIVTGRVDQGALLPNEAEMSLAYGVGRSAVREAVKMLAAKGLVNTRPRRGTQVNPTGDWNLLDAEVLFWLRQAPPDRRTIVELIELRLGFEPEAAALAARKGRVARIADIRRAYELMESAGPGTVDPVEADCRFHEAVLAATENRFYQPLGSLVRTALSLTAPVTNALFGHSVGDLEAHRDILVAIEAHDDALAYDRVRRLLRSLVNAVEHAEKLPASSTMTRRA